MAETYQFVWGEVGHIRRAIGIARQLESVISYAHVETPGFDLNMDRIGIQITIPHDRTLKEERRTI